MAAETYVPPSPGRRVGAVLLALLNLAGAAILGFLGLLARGLRCDDNCSSAPGWRNDPNAWQWDGIVVLALVILGSALVLNFAVLTRGAQQLRSVAVGVQLAAVALLVSLSFTATDNHRGWHFLAYLFVFFGATGVGAAWWTSR